MTLSPLDYDYGSDFDAPFIETACGTDTLSGQSGWAGLFIDSQGLTPANLTSPVCGCGVDLALDEEE